MNNKKQFKKGKVKKGVLSKFACLITLCGVTEQSPPPNFGCVKKRRNNSCEHAVGV